MVVDGALPLPLPPCGTCKVAGESDIVNSGFNNACLVLWLQYVLLPWCLLLAAEMLDQTTLKQEQIGRGAAL